MYSGLYRPAARSLGVVPRWISDLQYNIAMPALSEERSPVPLNGQRYVITIICGLLKHILSARYTTCLCCRSLLNRLFSFLPSWRPTSEKHLEEAEREILKGIELYVHPHSRTPTSIHPYTHTHAHRSEVKLPGQLCTYWFRVSDTNTDNGANVRSRQIPASHDPRVWCRITAVL